MANIQGSRSKSDMVRGIVIAGIVMTMSYGVIFVVNQQLMRQSANDPQVQMVEDYGNQLASGSSLSIFNGLKMVDIEKSLAPYVMVYDDKKEMKFSSARLNAKIPEIPAEVLDSTRSHLENRISWMPETGIRQAIVVRYFQGNTNGFVVAGRSLREVELREDILLKQMLSVWGVSILFIVIVELLVRKLIYRK